ncbi:MAG: hypothetical protein ABL962_05810 [Fimbriimonadaceae bacterium]
MNRAYVYIGAVMAVFGTFAIIDLITNSGFREIQTPKLGSFGILGPAMLFTGLVFAKFQGRRFANRAVGVGVSTGVILQTLGTLPFVQPRILAATAGHAGVGINEIISVLLILGGMAGFLLSVICVLAGNAQSP